MFLQEAIDSVIDQLDENSNVEVIVSTCFDTTTSAHITTMYNSEIDKGVLRFITFPKAVNYGEQFVQTFELSSGDIIFILEDDDIFLPEKISKVSQLFEDSDEIICVKDNAWKFRYKIELSNLLKILEKTQSVPEKISIETNYKQYKRLRNIKLWDWPSSIVLKREIITQNRHIILCNDPIDALIGIALLNSKGICIYFDYPLTGYRVHSSNDSISLMSINDSSGFKKWLKTINKYYEGYFSALRIADTFSLQSKMMLREYYLRNLIARSSAGDNNITRTSYSVFKIVFRYLMENLPEVFKANIKFSEKMGWYNTILKNSISAILTTLKYYKKIKTLIYA